MGSNDHLMTGGYEHLNREEDDMEAKQEHTPSEFPWRQIQPLARLNTIVDTYGNPIAIMQPTGIPGRITANGNLCAAAPQLLEVLQAVVEEFERPRDSIRNRPGIMCAARAALAAATGDARVSGNAVVEARKEETA